MKNEIIYPNFSHSILNLSATYADFVGVKEKINKIELVANKLKNAPKKVVSIIFDGLGVYDINELTSKNTFYKNHIADVISSTMPATTTNATTCLSTTKYPAEHLFLAWSLWLKKQNLVSEIYLNRDYYTHEPIQPYEKTNTCFLEKAKTNRNLLTIAPSYANYSNKVKKINANSVEELFSNLDKELKTDTEDFIYCYCDEPDHTMHDFGVHSEETKAVFENIQTNLEKLVKNNKDVLIITTADHGHIDIKKYINIYEDKEIMELQTRPLSMENRFTSFKIKTGKEEHFKELFNSRYGKYFNLLTKNEIIEKQIFGIKKNIKKIEELIGDFVAIGNESFYGLRFHKNASSLKGNHAGGTKQEMEVPICIFEN